MLQFVHQNIKSSPFSSLLQKEYVHRTSHPGEERDGGGESESNNILQQLLWWQKVTAFI